MWGGWHALGLLRQMSHPDTGIEFLSCEDALPYRYLLFSDSELVFGLLDYHFHGLQLLSNADTTYPANICNRHSVLRLLILRLSSADHHDTSCGMCCGNLQLDAVRPSAFPNAGTPTDALSLGGAKILPLVDHHGTRCTRRSTAAEKLRRPGTSGPQQRLNHARNHANPAASQEN